MADHLTQLLEPYLRLFDVKSIEAMGLRVLGAVLILIAGFWISRILQRILSRRIQRHDADRDGAVEVYRTIVRVATLVVAAALALHTLGIDLTHLFTTGGLLALAAAFAMKTAAENFICGLIIRLENELKPGDVLAQSDGTVFKVKKIGLRDHCQIKGRGGRDCPEHLFHSERHLELHLQGFSLQARDTGRRPL
jgi:small-conductance mechanosensitive channel